ncbi:SgcJ/EcaC family oxidoreductase [Candidatus Methylospira mobilis]|nr:SgcJ/EcaC family oxidoreductase [Candidatus Methylospira mobilis]WNV04182.1 SgcJ/EcaC family oxidoreductase [Candidatus Methylospira mobilis]
MSYRLKLLVAVIFMAINIVIALPGIAADKASEAAAIKEVISHWDVGWNLFDAKVAAQDYADDTDWINSFGVSKKGKAEIQQFLDKLFKSPKITPRKSTPSTSTIRFIRPDIAVASSYRETIEQKTNSGDVYPTRKTRDLRVLVLDKGKWVITSHLIADEKEVKP